MMTYHASGLWPAEIYSMAGHTFAAEVAHPFHDCPFRPEVTTVIDVATRKLVGWSVTPAESSLAVLDALRHSVESCGIPAVLYVDNSPGLMEDPLAGFMAKFGIAKQHPLSYSPQARGIIGRLQCTVWVRLAKELVACIGEDMDREARQREHKIPCEDVQAAETRLPLPSWPEFLARCEAAVTAYNDRPHSSLPKITDSETGKVRHQTPNERWSELTAANPACVVTTAAQGESS